MLLAVLVCWFMSSQRALHTFLFHLISITTITSYQSQSGYMTQVLKSSALIYELLEHDRTQGSVEERTHDGRKSHIIFLIALSYRIK